MTRPLLLVSFLLLMATTDVYGQRRSRQSTPVENLLENTSWKVDGVPFESADRNNYVLTAYDPLDFNDRWGHFIAFDTNTFSGSYSAPCGNDCFTRVSGKYEFKSALCIRVKVLTIERSGFCEQKSESPNRDYGLYNLEKTETGWKLVRAL